MLTRTLTNMLHCISYYVTYSVDWNLETLVCLRIITDYNALQCLGFTINIHRLLILIKDLIAIVH